MPFWKKQHFFLQSYIELTSIKFIRSSPLPHFLCLTLIMRCLSIKGTEGFLISSGCGILQFNKVNETSEEKGGDHE